MHMQKVAALQIGLEGGKEEGTACDEMQAYD